MMEEKNKKLAELEKQQEILAKQKEAMIRELVNLPVVGKDIVDVNARIDEIKAMLLSEIKQESEKLLALFKKDIESVNARITGLSRSSISSGGLTMTDILSFK